MLSRFMWAWAALLLLTQLSPNPVSAGNGAIGVYFDADCGRCSGTVSVGVPFTLYVNATLAGGTAGGIAEADFGLLGIPTSWIAWATPNPLAGTSGDVLQGGAFTFFDPCISSTQGCVNLYTIWVLPTTVPVDGRVVVSRCYLCAPPFELFLAPLLRACDFTRYWVAGGAAILNGPPCTVGTTPSTWSRVKQLYRNADSHSVPHLEPDAVNSVLQPAAPREGHR